MAHSDLKHVHDVQQPCYVRKVSEQHHLWCHLTVISPCRLHYSDLMRLISISGTILIINYGCSLHETCIIYYKKHC